MSSKPGTKTQPSGEPEIKESTSKLDSGRLLTATEIADYVGVRPKTIYNWVSIKFIPCIRISNRLVRFRLEDIEKWCSTHKQPGRSTRKINTEAYH